MREDAKVRKGEFIMGIKIMNLRNDRPSQPYDVKIDRSSPLGNNNFMQNESQRDKVCEAYEIYINNAITNGNVDIIEALNELLRVYRDHGELRLFCWCSPKRCHGETIKKLLEEKLRLSPKETTTT